MSSFNIVSSKDIEEVDLDSPLNDRSSTESDKNKPEIIITPIKREGRNHLHKENLSSNKTDTSWPDISLKP